jgi:hypothetical protein
VSESTILRFPTTRLQYRRHIRGARWPTLTAVILLAFAAATTASCGAVVPHRHGPVSTKTPKAAGAANLAEPASGGRWRTLLPPIRTHPGPELRCPRRLR